MAEEPYKPDEQLLSQAHPAFRYIVSVDGMPFAAFTECTLPGLEWDVEELKEGGLNTRVHQLLGRRKATRLILKYGVCKDLFWQWYTDLLSEKFDEKRNQKNISIQLLDVQFKPIAGWHIKDAYPIKWGGPQLRADANSIAIQTLEFACGAITLDDVGAKAPEEKKALPLRQN